MPSIQYGLSAISFDIRRASRTTLAIHVFPDGGVLVDAPTNAVFADIEAKVKKHSSWILKQQRLFASYPEEIPARKYESGESFRYLGRQYRLRVIKGEKNIPRSAKLKGGWLLVSVWDGDGSESVKKLMEDWLRSKAEYIFSSLLHQCASKAALIGVHEPPPLKILRMKTRWGSCTKEGVVILNPELVAAPKACIEYVIFHELCHLREKNHSPSFYRLLSRLVPEWESIRLKLNQTVELRLDY